MRKVFLILEFINNFDFEHTNIYSVHSTKQGALNQLNKLNQSDKVTYEIFERELEE